MWVTGATESREFPNLNGWSSGGEFVVGFDPEGAGLLYSARYPSGLAGADIAADSTGAVRVTGGGGLVSVLEPRQPPPMLIGAIGNAAGGPVSGRIAPGELVSIYGPGIGPATPATAVLDGTGRVAKSLAGVQVLFDGIAAPLLYVSSTQINAIVPFALRDKKSADIRVSLGSVTSPTFAAAVLPTAPEIFRSTGDFAAALNENGSINSSSQPARWGSVVTIWATGTGAIPAADGEVAASAENYYCCEVEVGSRRLEVLYAGASPGLAAGVTQINFRLLEQQFGRTIGVRIRAGGRTSRGVILYVD